MPRLTPLLLLGMAWLMAPRAQAEASSPRRLDPHVRIVHVGRTLDELVATTHPTARWTRDDGTTTLLWVSVARGGAITFRLGQVIRVPTAADGALRPAIIEPLPDDPRPWDSEYRGEFLCDELPLVARHEGDHGSEAWINSRGPAGQTLYELNWEAGPARNGNWVRERHIFLLADANGSWRLLGEGPEESVGHAGAEGWNRSVEYHVTWPDGAPHIEFLETAASYPLGEEAERDSRSPPLDLQRGGLATVAPDGRSGRAAGPGEVWTVRLYPGDTAETVEFRLARWSDDWDFTNRPESRAATLRIVREVLTALNGDLPTTDPCGPTATVRTLHPFAIAEIIRERRLHGQDANRAGARRIELPKVRTHGTSSMGLGVRTNEAGVAICRPRRPLPFL
jgi:hypothetical protein